MAMGRREVRRRRLGDRWGATPDEIAADYPCDEFVPSATCEAWRAVTVDAPIGVVWRWLMQVRLAPYSYDWIDNLGRKSPDTMLMLDDPQVGQHFSTAFGRRFGEVLAVEPQRSLTARIMGTTMCYDLHPIDAGRTRLVLKLAAQCPPVLAEALAMGDLVMARRQLLNFKKLAELSAVNAR